jgi:hypothetical protein
MIAPTNVQMWIATEADLFFVIPVTGSQDRSRD